MTLDDIELLEQMEALRKSEGRLSSIISHPWDAGKGTPLVLEEDDADLAVYALKALPKLLMLSRIVLEERWLDEK